MKNNLLWSVLFVGAILCSTNSQATTNSNRESHKAIDPAIEQMYLLQQQQMQMQQQMLETQRQTLEGHHDSWERNNYDYDQDDEYQHSRGKSSLWIRASYGDVPHRAFSAGYDRDDSLYICHTEYRNGVEVGQLVDDGCLISYAGKAFVISDYQVLTAKHRFFWAPANALTASGEFNSQFASLGNSDFAKYNHGEKIYPVKGGIEPERTLYICRTMYANSLHVGKIVAGNCNIGINNTEQVIPTYEVLFK